MRGAELVIGGLLVALVAMGPLGAAPVNLLIDDPFEATATLPEWTYSGSALLETPEAGLRARGPFEMKIDGAATLEIHELLGYNVRANHTIGGLDISYQGGLSKKVFSRTYGNGTTHVTGENDGRVAFWSNLTQGPARFTLAFEDTTNSTIQPSNSSVSWSTITSERLQKGAPLFALGHGNPPKDHPGRVSTAFRGLEASGDLRMIIWGGTTINVVHEGGEEVQRTWTTEGLSAGEAPARFSVGDEHQYATLTLHKATASMGFERVESAEFVTSAAEWAINGTLAFTAEEGKVHAGGTDRTLQGDRVEIIGNTTFDAQTEGLGDLSRRIGFVSTPSMTPLSESEVQAGMEGDAEKVSVNGKTLSAAPSGQHTYIPEEVTFLAKVLAVAFVIWSIARYVLPLVIGRSRAGPLAHPRRLRIYSFLEKQGIAHMRAISRDTQIPIASLNHHLSILRREGLVQRICHGNRHAYFIPSPNRSREDMRRIAALAETTRLDIARILTKEGSLSQGAIQKRLGLPQSTISDHLLRLEEDGLVERSGTRRAEFRPTSLLQRWIDDLGSCDPGNLSASRA